MTTPNDRRYTATHEWHKVEGDTVTIGLTRHAVDALTDVTYVDLKPAGTRVGAGDSVGEVESVKTTSDIYAALPGEIIAVNSALDDNPGLLNENPYDNWLVRLKAADLSLINSLMDASAYDKHNGG